MMTKRNTIVDRLNHHICPEHGKERCFNSIDNLKHWCTQKAIDNEPWEPQVKG